ncbi:MAG TPA: DUF6683 family protein [Burkholderiaceae bacterium]|nr:DUF6683 family protein [Burkholderiaceae bacterium]
MTQTRSIHHPPQGQQAQQIEDAARLLRNVLTNALLQAGLGGGSDQPALRVARATVATAPAQMAAELAADDAATREQITASYEHCLVSYRALEPTRGEPDVDDVGLAMAFFVAINLRVLHGVDADADMLRSLEQQLRGVTRTRSNWDAASIEERQSFFERTAIASVVMSASAAGAAARGPEGVANVQRAARQYLEQMLGMNPDCMTLGPSGLTAREPDAAPTPMAAEQTA